MRRKSFSKHLSRMVLLYIDRTTPCFQTFICFIRFDIDSDALEACSVNVQELIEEPCVDLVLADVRQLRCCRNTFDTVILNPPFGTKKNKGMDIEFLKVIFNKPSNIFILCVMFLSVSHVVQNIAFLHIYLLTKKGSQSQVT